MHKHLGLSLDEGLNCILEVHDLRNLLWEVITFLHHFLFIHLLPLCSLLKYPKTVVEREMNLAISVLFLLHSSFLVHLFH